MTIKKINILTWKFFFKCLLLSSHFHCLFQLVPFKMCYTCILFLERWKWNHCSALSSTVLWPAGSGSTCSKTAMYVIHPHRVLLIVDHLCLLLAASGHCYSKTICGYFSVCSCGDEFTERVLYQQEWGGEIFTERGRSARLTIKSLAPQKNQGELAQNTPPPNTPKNFITDLHRSQKWPKSAQNFRISGFSRNFRMPVTVLKYHILKRIALIKPLTVLLQKCL